MANLFHYGIFIAKCDVLCSTDNLKQILQFTICSRTGDDTMFGGPSSKFGVAKPMSLTGTMDVIEMTNVTEKGPLPGSVDG